MADTFDLKTSWASQFAEKVNLHTPVSIEVPTNTNDSKAIGTSLVTQLREACASTAPSGKVIKLPAVTIDLGNPDFGDQTPLLIYGGNLLRGAGMGKTIIRVGGQYKGAENLSSDAKTLIRMMGDDIGLCDLTIVNDSANKFQTVDKGVLTDSPECGVINGNYFGTGYNNRIVWDRVEFALGLGFPAAFAAYDWLVRNCRFTTNSLSSGGVRLLGFRGLFLNNSVSQRAGRSYFNFCTGVVIRGNVFRLSGPRVIQTESGCIELTFSKDVVLVDNLMMADGQDVVNSSGEIMTSQVAEYPEWFGKGEVKEQVTGTTIVTTARRDLGNGSPTGYHTPDFEAEPRTERKAIFVATGPGARQWRWVTETTDGTYCMDRPLDVMPSVGDIVTISSVPAYRVSARRNVLSGGSVGLQFFGGGIECECLGN